MPATTHSSAPPRHDHACSCGDASCDSGLRNNFFIGKRMSPAALRIEQRYHVERRRLINRAVHGWGVVYGFPLNTSAPDRCAADGERRLRIGAGLAFDECGRELVETGRALALDDVFAIVEGRFAPAGSRCRDDAPSPWKDSGPDTCWLLKAHYAERSMSQVDVKDPCQCTERAWDHVCETVVYSLERLDDCAQCCAPAACRLDCECGAGPCCEPDKEHPGREASESPTAEPDNRGSERAMQATVDRSDAAQEEVAHRGKPFTRGGCRCLCDHLMHLDIEEDCDALCEVRPGLRVSPCSGIPLACLKLEQDRCGDWTFAEKLEACGPRRLVKRNDLLFDLIHGCDLTHIERVGWAPWHRKEGSVGWQAFKDSFGGEGAESRYTVRFSRPVRKTSVLSDCFDMRFLSLEHREGGYEQTHAPISRIVGTHEKGDPPNTWREVRLEFEPKWVGDAIRGGHTLFRHQVRVEIEVRGDFILDCNGQAIDANAIGLQSAPTGNGAPGGTYLSTFRIGPAED